MWIFSASTFGYDARAVYHVHASRRGKCGTARRTTISAEQ